jgi:hypothetical protein
MIKYWYCGNIPPRPLDEKVEDLESWNGQDEKKNLWTNQRLRRKKKFVFETKKFHKTLVAVCECGRLEVGRLEGGRLG